MNLYANVIYIINTLNLVFYFSLIKKKKSEKLILVPLQKDVGDSGRHQGTKAFANLFPFLEHQEPPLFSATTCPLQLYLLEHILPLWAEIEKM